MSDRPQSVSRTGSVPLHEVQQSLKREPVQPEVLPPASKDLTSATGALPPIKELDDDSATRDSDDLSL